MIIAEEKRKNNIAEYILYMWQIEDLIRACQFDLKKIDQQIIQKFQVSDQVKNRITDWYANLILMMEKEGLRNQGHLQILKNLVNDLNQMHRKLIQSNHDPEYSSLYQINLPSIEELSIKSGNHSNEIETCLNALYGVVLLKLQKKEINPSTVQAMKGFGKMLGHLSARYKQFENGEFEF